VGQADQLVARLKKKLKEQGVTYKTLAPRLGLCESALKRAFSQGRFTLKRLEEICEAVGVDMATLFETRGEDAVRQLSEEQDAALAADPKLFGLFYLLGSGLTVALVLEKFRYTRDEIRRLLSTLDALALLELLPGDRIRMKVKQNVWWSERGPLARRYNDSIRVDFVRSEFDGEHEDKWFLSGRASPSSLSIVSKKMNALINEFRELVELDEALPYKETVAVTFYSAYRPWVMPVLRDLRRAAPSRKD
jgi:transcriptional regulator with XRE-family HTH domain